MAFPNYEMTWGMAMLLGSVLSATDPVAVVALLRELGASKTLSILIEGESLLNDGVAIVIFAVLKAGVVEGVDIEPGAATLKFLIVGLGGPLVGFVFGMVCTWLLGMLVNNDTVEMLLTFTFPYITFYLAEIAFEVSGVLAVVVLGMYLNVHARTLINPEINHQLEHFYELMAFIANTIIFVLCGVVVGRKSQFATEDITWLFVLYFGMTAIRLFAVALLSPILSRIGYGLTWKEAVIVAWGGLRGSLGLALALVLQIECRVLDSRFGELALFYVGGIVVLTLVVNGTTTGPLLRLLGMTKMSMARAVMIRRSIVKLRRETEQRMAQLQLDPFLSDANWEYVRERMYSPPIPKRITNVIVKWSKQKASEDQERRDVQHGRSPNGGPKALEEKNSSFIKRITTGSFHRSQRQSLFKAEQIKMKKAAYKAYFGAERHSYWTQFVAGTLSRSGYRKLSSLVDEKVDYCTSLINKEDLLSVCQIPFWLNRLHDKLKRVPLLNKLTQSQLYGKLLVTFDVLLAWLRAREEVISLIQVDTGISENWQAAQRRVFHGQAWRVLMKGITDNSFDPGVMHVRNQQQHHKVSLISDKKMAEQLFQEGKDSELEIKAHINVLTRAFPDICIAIKSNLAASKILKLERETIHQMEQEGTLELEFGVEMTKGVKHKVHQLNKIASVDRPPTNEEIVGALPWVRHKDGKTRKLPAWFLEGVSEATYHEGDFLYRRGETHKGITLINRGLVNIYRHKVVVANFGPGQCLGEWEFMAGEEEDTFEATAKTYLHCLLIKREALSRLLQEIPYIQETLWNFTLKSQSILQVKLQEIQDGFVVNDKHDQRWAEHGEMKTLKTGEEVLIQENQCVLSVFGQVQFSHARLGDNESPRAGGTAFLGSDNALASQRDIRFIGEHDADIVEGHPQLVQGAIKITCTADQTHCMVHYANYEEGLTFLDHHRRGRIWKKRQLKKEGEGFKMFGKIAQMAAGRGDNDGAGISRMSMKDMQAIDYINSPNFGEGFVEDRKESRFSIMPSNTKRKEKKPESNKVTPVEPVGSQDTLKRGGS